MDETEAVLQHVLKNSFRPRDLVGRHAPSGGRQAGSETRAAQNQGAADCQQDPGQIDAQHGEDAVIGEKDLGQDQVDWQFGAARQERDHGDGQPLVAAGRKHSGGQDRGHAAAEPGDQWQDGSARQPDAVHGQVQDPRDPVHVAAVFQQGQEEKQCRNGRQKRQDAANAGADPVDDQFVDPERYAAARQLQAQQVGQMVDQLCQGLRQESIGNFKCAIEYASQNH